jgi:CARDB
VLGAIRLSFLDEPDEPVRRPTRRPPRGPSTDRQTLMVRRTIAAGAALLVLILLVIGFKGCLNARKERAMEDYVRDSNELITLSKSESTKLFNALSAPNAQDQAVSRQNQANELRSESETIADRAHDLDVPDELSSAQGYLTESLDLRRDALAEVAKQLPTALAQEERRTSTARIAQMMQVFLASDVLLKSRFKPILRDALEQEDISAQVPSDQALTFVTNLDWLQSDFVADQIAGIRGSGGSATPGLHGNGLGTVSLGGVALTPGGSATVHLTRDTAFDIQVTNQGESTETDVVVNVTVGQGGDAIDLEETLPEIAPGETKTVSIPLSEQPPTGQNVPLTVRAKPVPGEEVTDNNEAEFTVIFTR